MSKAQEIEVESSGFVHLHLFSVVLCILRVEVHLESRIQTVVGFHVTFLVLVLGLLVGKGQCFFGMTMFMFVLLSLQHGSNPITKSRQETDIHDPGLVPNLSLLLGFRAGFRAGSELAALVGRMRMDVQIVRGTAKSWINDTIRGLRGGLASNGITSDIITGIAVLKPWMDTGALKHATSIATTVFVVKGA
jgi:hypothetical protein